MANETYLKPYDVTFATTTITKVDRVRVAEAAQGRPLYGDAAVWPTSNRRNLRNARITVECRDHAAYDALAINNAGSLALKVKVEKTGAVVSKTFANLVLTDKNLAFGGDVEVAVLVFEVEDETGTAGPFS